MSSKHKTRHKNFSGLKIAAGLLIFLGLLFEARNIPIFKAKRIECYTQFGLCPSELSAGLEWLKGTSLLFSLPTSRVRSQMSSIIEFQSVSLHRRLPSTVIVSVVLKKPLGALGPNVLGAQSIVDYDGQVYKQLEKSDLPLLFIDPPPPLNSQVTGSELKALQIMENLSSLSDYRLSASLSGTSLDVNLLPGIQVTVDVNRPLADWYPSLQLILSRSKITAKVPHKIDLRFDNSVIMY
jgi:hypothetical protein